MNGDLERWWSKYSPRARFFVTVAAVTDTVADHVRWDLEGRVALGIAAPELGHGATPKRRARVLVLKWEA